MIFATVGLERFPFDRLLRILDGLVESRTIREPLFGQIGHSRYEPKHFEFCRFLPFDQMRLRLQEADTVVCHGGVGTILLARDLGKVPLVFPRRAEFGEQLDDHQLDLAARLKTGNQVRIVDSAEDLARHFAGDGENPKTGPVRTGPPELAALAGFLRSILQDCHGR